jgi:subtilisin family serine protease
MEKTNKTKIILMSLFLVLFLMLPSFSFSNRSTFDAEQDISTSLQTLFDGLETTRVSAQTAEQPVHTSEANPQDFRPTNSNYHPQWNHNVMNIGQAWADGYTGEGVTIAILDTGFHHRHEDLDMVGGYSVFPDDPWSNDHSGHGTHIAGIIGARPGSAYQGIAPGADLYGIKIYNSNDVNEDGEVTTDVASVIRGIRHAIEIETDIIVISSGLSYHDEDLYEIIQEAYAEDILIIAASGNGSPEINYPAAYPEVLAITAVDEQLNPARDIIYGQENEFTAPGVTIGGLSIPSSPYGYPYIYMSGSSQAAPHAAGLAAIYMEKYGVRGQEVREIMANQAEDIGENGLYGNGLLRYAADEVEEEAEEEVVETTNEENVNENENENEDESDSEEATDAQLENDNYVINGEEPEVQKPASARESTEEAGSDQAIYYQVDATLQDDRGIIAEGTLPYVETGGTIEVNLNNISSLALNERQVNEIRERNISLILVQNEVSWAIPPANILPGEVLFRFFEGAPTGIEIKEGQVTDIYTLSIYQADKRSESYPGWMEVRFNVSNLDNTVTENLQAYYWDREADEWVESDYYETSGDVAAIRTRYTTAVGFFDPSEEENEQPEEEVAVEETPPEESNASTGLILFILGVVGVTFFLVRMILHRE